MKSNNQNVPIIKNDSTITSEQKVQLRANKEKPLPQGICHLHFTDEKTEVLTDLRFLRSHEQLVKEPNPSDPVKCS